MPAAADSCFLVLPALAFHGGAYLPLGSASPHPLFCSKRKFSSRVGLYPSWTLQRKVTRE